MSGALQVVIGVLAAGLGFAAQLAPAARALIEPQLGEATEAAAFGAIIAGGLWVVFGVLTMIVRGVGGAMGRGEAEKADAGAAQRQLDTFHEILGGAVA
ncbi:MAG: hypothetical protein MI723_12220, partial [Caulobacterales bacterium]|nr:hypothetical protein [Caulobacterales bacterium]